MAGSSAATASRPTTRNCARAALLPMGGPDGGYKGYGLAVIVEILCGLLTGLGFGVEPTGRHNDGCFMACFKVDAFRPLAEFKKEVSEFILLEENAAGRRVERRALSWRDRTHEGTRPPQEWHRGRGFDLGQAEAPRRGLQTHGPARHGRCGVIGTPVSADRLTLYGSFTSSSSYKPMLYLALARLPFSFRTVNLKIGVQKEAEYLAVNRYGVVPSLKHKGLTILQSNVILDYLARETGIFEGKTEQAKWQAREWLSWEADHITAVARVRHSARFRKMHDEVIAEFRPRAEAALSFVDKTVTNQPFLVGDHMTIADIGCWGRMVFMAEGGFDIANWPHLEAWAARMKAMPGFALPYDLLPSKDREFDPSDVKGMTA